MNLDLIYPEGNPPSILPAIPNKNGDPSGYLLIAIIRSTLGPALNPVSTIDRYACFTNYEQDTVWIEKLNLIRAKKWFVFEDTLRIDDEEEFNEIYNFLINKKVLGGKKRN